MVDADLTDKSRINADQSYEYKTYQLAVVDGFRINARRVLNLLLHLRMVSVYARLPMGQPGDVCNCRRVALHGLAARLRFRSTTPDALEDR